MKRRKAIGTILIAGGAAAAGLAGYEWYTISKQPDRDYLLTKKNLLAELAEIIIPATDTPGAKEAGAVEYMIPLLNECTDTRTLNKFIHGLQELEKYSETIYHRAFTDCSEREKEAMLRNIDLSSRPENALLEKAKDRYTGKSFFHTLKDVVVYSYCISQKGAGQGMRYIAVPGRYLSCVPLEPGQKAWATK